MSSTSVQDNLPIEALARPTMRLRETTLPRMVVGVTSAQTCLVLTGRLQALSEAGFEVTLISSPGNLLWETAAMEGVAACPIRMVRGISPVADFRSFLAILNLLWRRQPAITDFSTPKAGLLGNAAAWMVRVPHRVYTLRGLKLEGSRGWRRHLLLWSERLAAGCAHTVLCNSPSLRDAARALKIAAPEKLRILGDGSSNGVDTKRFAPGASSVRQNLGIPEDGLVIGFVGRLTCDKGVPELLVAFHAVLREYPQCWLVLVGWFDRSEDALDRRWREHIGDHPRIRHTGFVNDTARYYRAMDIFILPTHREGFPNVVLEAAACGLPVITTESTGARDAVIPEVTGLLIPPRYPMAIAEAALQLIEDVSKRKRMGEAARRWVLERYSQERVLGLATEFYLDMVRGTVSAGLDRASTESQSPISGRAF